MTRDYALVEEHAVTPLELFFDLVFVFAITQVTELLLDDPTWHGVGRAVLVLAAVWWSWTGYAWFTSALDVDEGGVRIVMLAATLTLGGIALSVPGAFADDAVLFGVSFLLFRVFHLVLYASIGRHDAEQLSALLRLVPSELTGAVLILIAAFVHDDVRIAVWIVALAVDYLGPAVMEMRGWHIAPAHFAERHGLVILIALGESIIAIGVGAGLEFTMGVLVAGALGFVVVAALWWLYFDVAAILARRRLVELHGAKQAELARDAYSYLHLPLVGGIVFFAFGLETTLHHIHKTLDTVPAIALCGGVALYLFGHVAFLRRTTRRIFRRRTLGVILTLALIPAALTLPAMAALALLAGVCVLVVAYEAIRHRTHRMEVRHPELRAS
jgi:low temperature requirement protein LtrA